MTSLGNYLLAGFPEIIEQGLSMLPETEVQQGLSFAYVRAIANVSDYEIQFYPQTSLIDALVLEHKTDNNGGHYPSGNFLAIQIKSTKNFSRLGRETHWV